MPVRPSPHQLEDQSRLAFQSLLPRRWLFRPKTPDYGIDGEIEIFDENDKATGDQFLVQLKAIERTPKSLSISLDIEWINYYRSLELPVLIALWSKESNKTFWIWATEIDLYYARPKAKSFTVRLLDVWDNGAPALIQRHLDLRRRLRSQRPPEQLRIALHAPGRSDLRLHLQMLCAHTPRTLMYNEDAADIACVLIKDELKISFSGLPGIVFHAMRNIDDQSAAKRIVIGVATLLANFGALSQAAELWAAVPDLDKGISSLDVAWNIVSMLARAGAYTELRALITALKPRFRASVLKPPIYALHVSAPQHQRGPLTDLLAELMQQDLQDTTPEAKSMASYSLARLYEETHRMKAIGHFANAIRVSPFYLDKAYFWAELGAFLFTHHRYHAALRCYQHAYEKLGNAERRSHYDDALMHTGQYLEALRVFRSIVEGEQQRRGQKGVKHDERLVLDIADATIKARALELITQVVGTESQKRQRRLAVETLGRGMQGLSNLDIFARSETAIRADAMCGDAWFNRGLAQQNLGREAEALRSFIAAAAVRTPDDEAWLKVLFLARKHDAGLMPSLLQFLRHLRGAGFVRYLTEAAHRRSDEVGRAILLELARIFAEHIPAPEDAVLRIHGKGGKTTTLRARTR